MMSKIIKTYTLFFSIFLICICFGSCKESTFHISNIESSKKDVFYADTGSYWVYENKDSFWRISLDSVYVSGKVYRDFKVDEELKSREIIKILTIKFSNNLGIELIGGGFNTVDLIKNYSSDYFPVTLWAFDDPKTREIDKPKVGQGFSAHPGFTINIIDSIFSSYTLNGNTFGETMVWHVKPDYVLQSKETIYYFAKGVGIIKILDKERKTEMNLIRYKYKRIVD